MISNFTVEAMVAAGGATPASPAPGATAGASVMISLEVANFELVEPAAAPAATPGGTVTPAATPAQASPPPAGGEAMGHIAYSLQPEGAADFEEPVLLAETEYTWEAVPAGTHTFRAELMDTENNPLDPEIFVEFMIGVPGEGMGAQQTPAASSSPTP
jgi:hypothetical protein